MTDKKLEEMDHLCAEIMRRKWQGNWQPTRNIAQAWEVLESLPASIYTITKLGTSEAVFDGILFNCQIRRLDDKDGQYIGTGLTAPEAIVNAFLKAKGID